MARGINKVILIGSMGKDPEVRYTAGGAAIANVTIATNESWKDKQTGEKQERTEWHRVVFFGRLAEIVNEYLKKGAKVYVEGRLQTRKWQGKDGQDRYTTEIVANEMQMLDRRDGGGSGGNYGGGGNQGGGNSPDEYDQSQPASKNTGGTSGGAAKNAPADDFDDDIPF